MNYDTALRSYPSKRIEEIESADILIGIPCYNNEKTIVHVIQMVTHGLAKYYKDQRSVIFIADGGSTDDTREVALVGRNLLDEEVSYQFDYPIFGGDDETTTVGGLNRPLTLAVQYRYSF